MLTFIQTMERDTQRDRQSDRQTDRERKLRCLKAIEAWSLSHSAGSDEQDEQ